MELVPVDTNMYTMCRLCLDEKGSFLITPNIKESIKYCFDIDIDPYDGLPQLICRVCETTLSEYSTKKKIFIGRQNALKAKIQVRKEVEEGLRASPDHDKVSSSQQVENEAVVRKYPKARRKSRITTRPVSSDSDSDRARPPSPVQERPRRKRKRSMAETWEAYFDKRYACKYCNKNIKGNITNHMKIHANLISDYENILNRNCSVQLNKLDSQKNITGSSRTLVLRPDKILGGQKENTFVVYFPKHNQVSQNDQINENDQISENKVDDSDTNSTTKKTDTDSEDEFIIKSKTIKRRRLLSTDTVILNNESKTPKLEKATESEKHETVQHKTAEIECIDLDDSSNSSSEGNDDSNKNNTLSIRFQDVEAIKNIMKVCHSRYVNRKNESSENESKSAPSKDKEHLLKHKLLSMGRKTIKSEGLSCTGLLRYVEHKNLDVKWIPTSMIGNKEGNYVRVMPRQKGKNELIVDNSNWKTKIKNKSNTKNKCGAGSSKSVINSEEIIENTQEQALGHPDRMVDIICLPSEVNQHDTGMTQARSLPILLISEGIIKQEENKKLLNANPVANPKQLPKKYGKNNITEHDFVDLMTDTPQEDMLMPIITSTTSLVEQSTDSENIAKNEDIDDSSINVVKKDKDVNGVEQNIEDDTAATVTSVKKEKEVDIPSTSSAIEKPAPPRLKVKPVSEINSEVNCRAVLTESNNKQVESPKVWTLAPTQVQITKVYSAPSTKEDQVPSDAIDQNNEQQQNPFVIMHTVELPNTKTNSPFRYIQDLLKVHNIVLLDSKETVPKDFICLIKFKLQLQRTVNVSVTLCVSVHCKENTFYLGVSYPLQPGNFDISKLSTHWQWEILKIYATREDVISKMTVNAEKISPSVYAFTKSFLCLMKSIQFKHCA